MFSTSSLERAANRKVAWLLMASLTTAALADTAASRPISQTNAPPRPDKAELARRVDDFLHRMSGFGYSGNILLRINGETVLRKSYGLADRERGTRYSPDTIFDIGSMAKTFTAAAVLLLEQQGRLRVDEPIERFFPNLPEGKRPITIHQLLSHTSGIVTDFPYTDPLAQYEDVTYAEAVRRVLAAPLEFAPGEGKQYSNGGYILLGAIVQNASGQPFQSFISESLFKPLGLVDTGFWGDAKLDRTRVATGYNEYGEAQHDPMARSSTTWQDLGGGQVLSTLDDLAKWWDGLQGGRVLPSTVVKRLWTPHTPELSFVGDYGYGWYLQKTDRGGRLIQHGGDSPGTGAQLSSYVDDDVLMITSTNVRHDLYPTRNRTDRVIPKILFGGEHPEPPAWVEDLPLLRSAAGEYALPTGGRLIVHDRGGRFFIGAAGQDGVELLMPADAEVRRKRADMNELAQRAYDGLRSGDTRELTVASGGSEANPTFVSAVVKEIADFGLGKLRTAQALGTFPTGFPLGSPPDFHATLLRLEFESGTKYQAIRWNNGAIGVTVEPRFHFAADTQIQADGNGGLVGWNIVFSHAIQIVLARDGGQVRGLKFNGPTGEIFATRSAK